MRVILNHAIKPIKGGFCAESAGKFVSHGRSPELARRALERTALAFLSPFERDGTLADELGLAGLQVEDDGAGLSVALVEEQQEPPH